MPRIPILRNLPKHAWQDSNLQPAPWASAARHGLSDSPSLRWKWRYSGAAGKMVIQFLAAASDRFHAQSADEGREPIAAMPEILGLQGHRPAALLPVQTAYTVSN
ncbi:MAG: hypothetical protein ABSA26_04800 [Thermoguttaceae bacterium]